MNINTSVHWLFFWPDVAAKVDNKSCIQWLQGRRLQHFKNFTHYRPFWQQTKCPPTPLLDLNIFWKKMWSLTTSKEESFFFFFRCLWVPQEGVDISIYIMQMSYLLMLFSWGDGRLLINLCQIGASGYKFRTFSGQLKRSFKVPDYENGTLASNRWKQMIETTLLNES